jgi:uncharacterized protein (DUF58 family)
MGLGRAAAPFVALGGLLAVSAVASGNLAVLGLAVLPLGLAVAAGVVRGARVQSAVLAVHPPRAVVGEELEILARLQVAGRGPLAVRVQLPDAYRLVAGSNVQHLWVERPGEVKVRFRAACDRRGVQAVGPLEAQAASPWGLGSPARFTAGDPVPVRVDPVAARLRRWPSMRSGARSPMAEMDLSPAGILTTHFQDIRPYVRGDPHRSINWKASARRGELAQQAGLMVNDYEREGRRQVWIFLDARPALVGTSLDNSLDRRIEAALALASVYLRRGFGLGLTLYNQPLDGTPYPDSSGRQERRILELVNALPAPPSQITAAATLGDAVRSVQGHLLRARTVSLVVTQLAGGAEEEEDLRTLRRALARRRGRTPIAVIHVDPAGLLPDAGRNQLARTLSVLDRPHLEAVRRLGIRAVRWDPSTQGLPALVRRLGR